MGLLSSKECNNEQEIPSEVPVLNELVSVEKWPFLVLMMSGWHSVNFSYLGIRRHKWDQNAV